MPGALLQISFLLLGSLQQIHGLCRLMNDRQTRCHELEDIKYIDAYSIESLRTSVMTDVLNPTLLKNLSTLKHLDLSRGKLKKITSSNFEELINLKSLDLANNQIDWLELDCFDNLNQLRSLNLRTNNLRYLPLALTKLKNLQHLDIHGNPLRCDCASLHVRDLLIRKGVNISKKVICAEPSNMKGIPLLKSSTKVVCAFDTQDQEMQADQPIESSGEGSGNLFDNFDEDSQEFDTTKDSTITEKSAEIETPFPENAEIHTVGTISYSGTVIIPTPASTVLEKRTDDAELFFDSDERRTTIPSVSQKKLIKDALFYPVEGSSDEDGSGEGSGTGVIDLPSNNDEGSSNQETDTNSSTSGGASLYDIFFGGWWGTTAAPEPEKDLNLEEEEFINVSSAKSPVNEEIIVPRIINDVESVTSTSGPTTSIIGRSYESVITTAAPLNYSKSGEVRVEVNRELAEMSPAIQSQKGMGSYVVLAVLLAILVGLIGLAAYKGDFCKKKKRKRSDMENGTELKDMQKSLLEVNSVIQPKITPNGNAESMPLVSGPSEQDHSRQNVEFVHTDALKSSNGTSQWDHLDMVEPTKKISQPYIRNISYVPSDRIPSSNSYTPEQSTEDFSHTPRTRKDMEDGKPPSSNFDEVIIPPSSPGAQRVKITLQDNPDSVPKTPILITKTMTGEKLVKMS